MKILFGNSLSKCKSSPWLYEEMWIVLFHVILITTYLFQDWRSTMTGWLHKASIFDILPGLSQTPKGILWPIFSIQVDHIDECMGL